MKLSVSTYSLSRWRQEEGKSVEQCLDWLAQVGVEAVEFSGLGERPFADPIRRARALRKRCDRLGLKVAGYCVGAELLKPPAQQRQEIERLKQQVDVAAELGAPSMRHDVTRGPAERKQRMSFPQVLRHVAPAVRQIADYAASRGLTSSLENHGFYLQTADRIERLIKAVDHPNYALTLDLGNFLCLNQDPVEAARRLAPYAVMVHAKDFHVRPKRQVPPGLPEDAPAGIPRGSGWFETPTPIALRGAIAGHGQLDLPAQLQILRRAG
ncbi:MAG TPA: sugar phosphate isomerase/epimerase family protein, partial [Phycisphaeraceae bacterium]